MRACVRGPRSRHWLPLPVVDVSGRECVQLIAGAPWLQHCLDAPTWGPWRIDVRNLVEECVDKFNNMWDGHGGEFACFTSIRRMQLTFTVLAGRKMYVPTDGPSLAAIISHIANGGVEPGPGFSELLDPTDRDRIGWRCAPLDSKLHGTWFMRYVRRSTASCHVRSKGFHVLKRGAGGKGKFYTDDEALDVARHALFYVKRMWNETDQSNLPRFPV